MKQLLSFFITVVIFINCSNRCKNCGCDNVDDCISTFKPEEARKYVSLSYSSASGGNEVDKDDQPKVMLKIIQAGI
jgi:hypothetical protein